MPEKEEKCLSVDPEEERQLRKCQSIFQRFSEALRRAKVLWALFTFGKKKTKVLCDAASYQESCDAFIPHNNLKKALRGGGGAVSKERLSAGVTCFHFSTFNLTLVDD